MAEHVKNEKGAMGFNAESGAYEDLMEAGVIDPTKVTRYAIQNAASVASLLITTEAMIAEKPKKESPDAPHGRRRHGRHGRDVLRRQGSGVRG